MSTSEPLIEKVEMSDARRAARNAGALLVSSLVSKGALFGWQLILAPWLGATAYGIYGTIGAMLAVGASLASFSMGLIVIRDVAREPENAGKYWSAALFIQTIFALVAYVAVNAFAISYSEAIRAFTAIATINLLIDVWGNMGYDLLIAREQMLKTSIVEVVHIMFRIGFAAVAISLGYGLFGVYGAAIITGIGRVFFLWWFNWRDGIRPQFPMDRAIAKLLLINSAPLALSAFLSLAYQHADKLMTTGFIGETNTGYLTAAFVINFGVIEMMNTTVLVATYPLMSRYYKNDDSDATFGFMVEKMSFFMFLLSLPLALILSIFSVQITVPLFGEDFFPTAGILSILIWYTAVTMVGNVFAQGMLVQNRQRVLVAIRVAGLAINIMLNAYFLLRFRDPRGAAAASVIAELVVVGLLIWQFRAVGWSWSRVLPGVLRLAVLGVLTAAIMLLLTQLHFLIGMIGGGLFFAAGVVVFILKTDDWDLFYRLLTAMPGGHILRRFWQRDIPVLE